MLLVLIMLSSWSCLNYSWFCFALARIVSYRSWHLGMPLVDDLAAALLLLALKLVLRLLSVTIRGCLFRPSFADACWLSEGVSMRLAGSSRPFVPRVDMPMYGGAWIRAIDCVIVEPDGL